MLLMFAKSTFYTVSILELTEKKKKKKLLILTSKISSVLLQVNEKNRKYSFCLTGHVNCFKNVIFRHLHTYTDT